MAWHLLGAKPLFESMLTNTFDHEEQTSMKFKSKY